MKLITTLVVSFLVCCRLEVRCGQAGVVSGLQAETRALACSPDATVSSTLILFSHLRWVSQVGLVSWLDFVCISHLSLLCYLLIYLTVLHRSSCTFFLVKIIDYSITQNDGIHTHSVGVSLWGCSIRINRATRKIPGVGKRVTPSVFFFLLEVNERNVGGLVDCGSVAYVDRCINFCS